MVGVTKVGRANVSYWIEAIAEGGEDYHTLPGELERACDLLDAFLAQRREADSAAR